MMSLRIEYQSNNFPASYRVSSGTLSTSWDELLWAAITIGRPSTLHVFRHGPSSFHEAIFRLALIRMAVEQDVSGYLRRTNAFAALDPTEKGMVSYFLGMVLCKLFAWRLLKAPWLLHLDVFRDQLSALNLGRSRPDLVGESFTGDWHAFESKGRSSAPTPAEKTNAKSQARRLVSVDRKNCSLHIGSFAFFRNDVLEFYWLDPDPDQNASVSLPAPNDEWRFYFEPSLRLNEEPDLALRRDEGTQASDRELADVKVEIHPEILALLRQREWARAKRLAQQLSDGFVADGYQPDGLRLEAGASWLRPYEPQERS